MKRKSDIGSWITMIIIIGVVSSFFSSDIQFGEFFRSLEFNGVEATLDTLKLGLAFVTFGILFFFLIFRMGSGDQGDRLLRDWEKKHQDEE